MKTEITETYESRDLTLCTYLVASGFTIDSYRVSKDRLMLFSFTQSKPLQEHVSNFYRMTAMINPTVYSNTLRNLKAMLHSGKQYERNYENRLTETQRSY